MSSSKTNGFDNSSVQDEYTEKFSEKLQHLGSIDNEIAQIIYDFVRYTIDDARTQILTCLASGQLELGNTYTYVKYFTSFSPIIIYVDFSITAGSIKYLDFFIDDHQPTDPRYKGAGKFIPFTAIEMKGLAGLPVQKEIFISIKPHGQRTYVL